MPHMFVNWCKDVFCTWHQPAPKIRICRYVCTRATSPPQKKEQKAQHRLRERHTHNATVIAQQGACNNYGQRYRGCTCCLMDTESLMIRRPFGSIDPNSIRETELHTECRRRRERESLNSTQHDRERDAARQRAAATRRLETDEARAERLRANRQRKATRRQHGHHFAGVQRKDHVLLRLGSPQGMPTERGE